MAQDWSDSGALYYLQGPFTYEAQIPAEINFVPLKQTKSFNAKELLEV